MLRFLVGLFTGFKCTLVVTFMEQDKSFLCPVRLACPPAVGWDLNMRIGDRQLRFQVSEISMEANDNWLGLWGTYVHLVSCPTNILTPDAILEKLKLDKRWNDK